MEITFVLNYDVLFWLIVGAYPVIGAIVAVISCLLSDYMYHDKGYIAVFFLWPVVVLVFLIVWGAGLFHLAIGKLLRKV